MKRSEYMLGGKDVNCLTAGQAMENRPRYCHATALWRNIASALVDRGYGSLPVVDMDMNLLGIVSEDDLLQAIVEERDESDLRAEDIMTNSPITVSEDTSIFDVIKILEEKKLIRVPVVKDSKLVGILTRRDILFCYLQAAEPMHLI